MEKSKSSKISSCRIQQVIPKVLQSHTTDLLLLKFSPSSVLDVFVYHSASKPIKAFFLSADASTYAHFLFNAFDMDRNGSIRFEDFVIGLSVLLRGSVTEKLNWAFNLYDINKDGYITKEVCAVYRRKSFDIIENRKILFSVHRGFWPELAFLK